MEATWKFTTETKYLEKRDVEIHMLTVYIPPELKEVRLSSFYINKKGRGYFASDLIPFKIPISRKQVKQLVKMYNL